MIRPPNLHSRHTSATVSYKIFKPYLWYVLNFYKLSVFLRPEPALRNPPPEKQNIKNSFEQASLVPPDLQVIAQSRSRNFSPRPLGPLTQHTVPETIPAYKQPSIDPRNEHLLFYATEYLAVSRGTMAEFQQRCSLWTTQLNLRKV